MTKKSQGRPLLWPQSTTTITPGSLRLLNAFYAASHELPIPPRDPAAGCLQAQGEKAFEAKAA